MRILTADKAEDIDNWPSAAEVFGIRREVEMKKILFGLKEQVVYGYSYPIFIKKKVPGGHSQNLQIGYATLMDNMPEVPEEHKSKDIMSGARQSRIVISIQQRYFRKLTPDMFEEIQNKILTGDKTDYSEVETNEEDDRTDE